MATAMILVPKNIRKGDIVTLKAMISHPMETGFRRTETGVEIPRNIIRHFACRYHDEVIFSSELFPAIAANPFFAFTTVATTTGPVVFTWKGDNGFEHSEITMLSVAG
ncbi:Sulphur oxidation protein SoxZ [Rhabdaerophilaceae bacterium]